MTLDEMLELTKCCGVCDAYKMLRSIPDDLAVATFSALLPLRPVADKGRQQVPLSSEEVGITEGFLEEEFIP